MNQPRYKWGVRGGASRRKVWPIMKDLPLSAHIALNQLPTPAGQNIALQIKASAERRLLQGHPWIFENSIRKQRHDGKPGDLTVIYDNKRRFLGIGLYDPDSPIRVKMLQHSQPAPIDADWFAAKVQAAAQRRQALQEQGMTGYRLIHGENDGLPGLIVDRYADTLVIKLYSAIWFPYLRYVLPALDAVLPDARWLLRMARNLPQQYGLHDGLLLRGDALDGPILFTENGLRFAADVRRGHKTGFFFDHRDNRARVRDLAQGHDVLDVFAYVGAFSLYAAHGGAERVLSVDTSKPALQAARANFAHNPDAAANTQHELQAGDAFDILEALQQAGRTFSMIVLDPPAFAKRKDEVQRALNAYERLTLAALGVLRRDGVLVMASCSSRVDADSFYQTIHRTSQQAGRELHELERSGHALDHPIGFPEGAYLKCLFARAT